MIEGPTSYHGGHSGDYCSHAADRLEDMVKRYIELGFNAVGITEHIPPVADAFVYDDEKALGLNARDLYHRFEAYFRELRQLQHRYKDKITIYAGMETETVTGYADHVRSLIRTFRPDYIVGSVHHVENICFDYSKNDYGRTVEILGSIDRLYERYFDLQYEMIETLRPFVVGHFDMVRLHDDHYHERMKTPEIEKRIDRNLELIRSLGLVLDFNLRPLVKGKPEPYLTPFILEKALELGIPAVPGDDSHCVAEAGLHVDTAIDILKKTGFETAWPKPRMMTPLDPGELS